ncbi:MAG: preprotein translocase subunit SecG [Armatimonadetes bacterium]|nr:preprotein translocase subunit SecG [Armatimonadota bacterium]
MQIVKILLMTIQTVAAIGLIAVVMSQTTKSEGLSGTIGGKTSASWRGKPGLEEKLDQFTKILAWAFMIASALVYIVSSK